MTCAAVGAVWPLTFAISAKPMGKIFAMVEPDNSTSQRHTTTRLKHSKGNRKG